MQGVTVVAVTGAASSSSYTAKTAEAIMEVAVTEPAKYVVTVVELGWGQWWSCGYH